MRNGAGELADALTFGQVERRDRCAAYSLVDPILDLLEGAFAVPLHDKDHMCARRRERLRRRSADPGAMRR